MNKTASIQRNEWKTTQHAMPFPFHFKCTTFLFCVLQALLFQTTDRGKNVGFFSLDQQDKKLMHYYSRFFMQYANFKIWIPLELLFCECNVWLERETERWLLKCTFGFCRSPRKLQPKFTATAVEFYALVAVSCVLCLYPFDKAKHKVEMDLIAHFLSYF